MFVYQSTAEELGKSFTAPKAADFNIPPGYKLDDSGSACRVVHAEPVKAGDSMRIIVLWQHTAIAPKAR